jgi:hypothetical protein
MNNQNFQSDIESLSDTYIKYTVSRVIADKRDNLLDMEVPAEFSERLLENNVEVNLYSLADNSLIFSDVIKNVSESIFTRTLQYEDNTQRTLLYIDFKKLPDLIIPVGRYSVTLNFFQDELGSYNDRLLKVSKISTSRNEVELKLTDTTKLSELAQFSIPRINVGYILPVLAQIFNQPDSETLDLPVSPAKIDSASIYLNFASGSGQKLIEYGFDEDDGSLVGINTVTQNILNEAYGIAQTDVINRMFSGSKSFTEEELSNIVINSIDIAYDSALNDEAINPQNYRFDLI